MHPPRADEKDNLLGNIPDLSHKARMVEYLVSNESISGSPPRKKDLDKSTIPSPSRFSTSQTQPAGLLSPVKQPPPVAQRFIKKSNFGNDSPFLPRSPQRHIPSTNQFSPTRSRLPVATKAAAEKAPPSNTPAPSKLSPENRTGNKNPPQKSTVDNRITSSPQKVSGRVKTPTKVVLSKTKEELVLVPQRKGTPTRGRQPSTPRAKRPRSTPSSTTKAHQERPKASTGSPVRKSRKPMPDVKRVEYHGTAFKFPPRDNGGCLDATTWGRTSTEQKGKNAPGDVHRTMRTSGQPKKHNISKSEITAAGKEVASTAPGKLNGIDKNITSKPTTVKNRSGNDGYCKADKVE